MILRVLTASLLLVSSVYATSPEDTASPDNAASSQTEAEKPKLDGKAKGGEIKRCTRECEQITVDHFVEVYGPICNPDTPEGKRILEKVRDYKAQLIMRKKGDPYINEKDLMKACHKEVGKKTETEIKAELKKCKGEPFDTLEARAILDPAKNAELKAELEAIEPSCDDTNIKLISQVDMLNNSPRLTSKFNPKLNGVLAKSEKMDPFSYGMQCIAQCRDPKGTTSGRDMKAKQIYPVVAETPAPTAEAVEAPAPETAAPEGETPKDAPKVDTSEASAPEAPAQQ